MSTARASAGGEKIQEVCIALLLQSSRGSWRDLREKGQLQEKWGGSRSQTWLVDSSYVGLFFLYQNIFKWLKKEENLERQKVQMPEKGGGL